MQWFALHCGDLFYIPVHMSLNHHRKSIRTFSIIVLFLTIGFCSFRIPTLRQPGWKNLKVLPATITHDSLDHLMDDYKYALGVRCNYCHATSKSNPRRMDMASDDNPKKEITRSMMRMTMEMNQKYISTLPHADTVKVLPVTCNTCHRGQAIPAADK